MDDRRPQPITGLADTCHVLSGCLSEEVAQIVLSPHLVERLKIYYVALALVGDCLTLCLATRLPSLRLYCNLK